MIVLTHHASPERRWLAHLVRAAAGAIRPGDRFDDDLPFEGLHVAELALRHRVAGLVHRGLAEGRIADALPSAFRERCRQVYFATLRKSTVAVEVGSAVLDALAEAGVAAAPLKGHALLDGPEAVYEDPGVRPLDDVDLIVARADLERAAGVLAELGFRPIAGRADARLAGGHELALHRTVAGIQLFVELHWAWAGSESLLRDFGLSGERFLAEYCDESRGGRLHPGRVGHLLFVAVHAARHAFSRWIWLVDLHRLVECGPPLDWDAVVAAARALRVRRPLYAGLLAARELLRTPVPKETLAALAPGPLRRQLLHRSLAASGAAASTPTPGRVAKLLLGESWWDVARTAAWAAAPGRAWYEERGAGPGLRTWLAEGLRPRPAGAPESSRRLGGTP